MLRTALKPRWLALLLVVLIAASGMAALGNWQLERSRERSADAVRERREAPPRPLEGLLAPRQTFPGRLADTPVSARGTWDAGHQLLVAGREQGGVDGYWVLTPLLLADGSAVPVVRGWTADDAAGAASAPPAGDVEVRGILLPAEPAPDRRPGEGSGLPAGQLPAVDVTALVKLWPAPLLTGYVVASEPGPGLTAAEAGGDEGGGLALQNLSYALQWWLFAALGLFFWWRLVRDDARGRLRPGDPAPGIVGDDGAQPGRADTPSSLEQPERKQPKVEQS